MPKTQADWVWFQENLAKHRPLQEPRTLTPEEIAEYRQRPRQREKKPPEQTPSIYAPRTHRTFMRW